MKYQSNTIDCTVKKQSVSFDTDCQTVDKALLLQGFAILLEPLF